MPADAAAARRHADDAASQDLSLLRQPDRKPERRAWTYAPPPSPGLAEFRKGGAARRAFLRHWTLGQFQNGGDILLYFAMKLLPAPLCSGLGARLGRFAFPRWHKTAVARMQGNLATLLPEAGAAERLALMHRNWENQGRLMTEFSVVNRMAKGGHVTVEGEADLVAAAARGPLILMGVHTGNWELIWPVVSRLGIGAALNYAPPKSPARHWIARRERTRAGIALLPPGRAAVRPALKRLQAGGTVIIFCDEGLQGRIRGPFLGRPPHVDGNLALVARLSRLTGAALCPIHVVRSAPTRFHVVIGEAFHLSPTADPDAALLDDVVRLNGLIEPVVRAHLDQWYFLDSAL